MVVPALPSCAFALWKTLVGAVVSMEADLLPLLLLLPEPVPACWQGRSAAGQVWPAGWHHQVQQVHQRQRQQGQGEQGEAVVRHEVLVGVARALS